MKKLLKIYLPIAILLVLLFLFLQPNPYFRRAIFYFTADISDYKIFPERTVAHGEYQPWKIAPEFNSYMLSSEDIHLLDSFKTTAFVVVKDTNLVFESYWDGYSENSKSSSFSMAKSIISLLTGIAIDEGLIESVDDPVAKYLPEFENKKYEITIRDLLTMSSGLKWNESYYNPFSETTKSYYGTNLDELVLKSKCKISPTKHYEYIVVNPQVLSIIIKRLTNSTLSEYTSEKLWKPLGAKNDASWSLDQEGGSEKATCCFNSNARDFARLGQLVLNKGKWNGKQIISESYLKEGLTPGSYRVNKVGKQVDFYGYQWWISKHNNLDFYYARGILGQYIVIIPGKNLVFVRLGHKRSKEEINHHRKDLFRYIDLALKIAE